MIFFRLLIAAAIVQHVQMQEFEYINIAAGEGGLHFIHPSLYASPGDVIIFGFGGPGPMNHSVTQGSFSNPCHPIPNGFFSGFSPVAPEAQDGDFLFLLQINTTEPIYYYCSQFGHCEAGMVGVINPPCDGSDSFIDYQSAAKLVTSAGPIPTKVMGGRLIPIESSPKAPPPGATTTGSPGLVSAVCSGSSSSSYATGGPTISSAGVGPTGTSNGTNATKTGIQPVFSSRAMSVYRGVRFEDLELTSLIWQAASWPGVIVALVLAIFVA